MFNLSKDANELEGTTKWPTKSTLNKASTEPRPALLAASTPKPGKIRRNSRTTYQHMQAASVSPEDFRATPAEDRCAHCCDRFTPMMNARRSVAGLPLYADAMTKTLK